MPVQTDQQRQARGVLHRAVPPHRHSAQLLQVPGDGDGEVLPGLHCTLLYCTVLYCTVLYCTGGRRAAVLYCTVLYWRWGSCCTVLYCTVLYCTVLYCTVLYWR